MQAVQSQVQAVLDLPSLQAVSLQLLEPKHRSELDVLQGHSEMTLIISDVHSLTEVVLCTQLRQDGLPMIIYVQHAITNITCKGYEFCIL